MLLCRYISHNFNYKRSKDLCQPIICTQATNYCYLNNTKTVIINIFYKNKTFSRGIIDLLDEM